MVIQDAVIVEQARAVSRDTKSGSCNIVNPIKCFRWKECAAAVAKFFSGCSADTDCDDKGCNDKGDKIDRFHIVEIEIVV